MRNTFGHMTKDGGNRCRNLFWGLFFVPALFANTAEKAPATLEKIRQIPHSGYSEGLEYDSGFLWNAFPKEIKKIDPADGAVLLTVKPATEYSESITWFQGVLWNVSFHDNSIHSGKINGERAQFEKRGTVPEVHAWGMAHNGKELIITGDYSNKLYFLDPKTAKVKRTLVTEGKDLEDLAWDGKWIWSSSFTEHKGEIFNIDPKSGKIGKYYKVPDGEFCPVIDGIAYDGKGLWITGKECPAIYYYKLPKN